MKNGTQSKKKTSIAQLLALASFIATVLAEILSAKYVQHELENKTKLRAKIFKLFNVKDTFKEIRENWQQFYKSDLDMDVDFTGVTIPERPEGNYCLLFIAEGLTVNKVFDTWKFPKKRHTNDLDKAVLVNKRNPTESYAIWVRDGIQPDEEFLGKSTRGADSVMEIGMTLLERMVFESKYFATNGKHLDPKSTTTTLCSGSRYSDSMVPCVNTDHDNHVCVHWYNTCNSNEKTGVRRAITDL